MLLLEEYASKRVIEEATFRFLSTTIISDKREGEK